MKVILVLACAAGLGVTSAAAQSAQSTQPGQSNTQQSQKDQQKQAKGSDGPRALQNVVSMSGCVYQTSDQPTLFAIRRMDHDSSRTSSSTNGATTNQRSATSTERTSSTTSTDSTASSRDTQSTASRGTQSTEGASASSGTDATHPNATSSAGAGSTEGAWYRLTPTASQNLKQYVGQRVQVNGQLTPGRDPQGHEIVIHRITPEKTVVTAIDLQPAPELSISSITPLGGTCSAAQGSDK